MKLYMLERQRSIQGKNILADRNVVKVDCTRPSTTSAGQGSVSGARSVESMRATYSSTGSELLSLLLLCASTAGPNSAAAMSATTSKSSAVTWLQRARKMQRPM